MSLIEYPFQANLLEILDGPVQNHQENSSVINPLEQLFFDTDVQENHANHSHRLAIPPLTVIDRNGLRIIFTFERNEDTLTIHSKATNSTSYPMMNFVFKAAVPKVRTRERLIVK